MALESTDLLVLQRPASKQHYKIEVGAFNESSSSLPDGNNVGDILIWSGTEWEPKDFESSFPSLPDGNDVGDILIWSGTEWEPKFTIDGGTY